MHCKAGLGRTGTNIGKYMIKHYGYTTNEMIGEVFGEEERAMSWNL